MPSAMIGALRVDLGLNSAAFEKGLTRTERKMARFGKQMEGVGKKMKQVGASITRNISLPAGAAAAAFGVAANQIAHDARDIANSARLAGEGFEEFQRQAHAAKTVGIETEKLADIFKDMRDRVGDFMQTGGGPMADFFENIAPKVGVTAEQFRGLSGKDALQLFYNSLERANVSSEEMVFYMEAMASDATALIPLLRDNGKAMQEMGENASVISDEERVSLERYVQAQEKLGVATRDLTIALVDSGILDAVTGLVEKFAQLTSRLADTNPGLLKAGVAFTGVAMALGPVVKVFGVIMTSWRGVVAAFKAIRVAALLLMANPIILGFAAVIAGIYLAWQNWDKIKPYITAISDAVSEFWTQYIKPVFDNLKGILFGAVRQWFDLQVGIIRAITSIATAIWDWGSGLVSKMIEIGGDVISGMVQGIMNARDAVWNALKKVIGFGVDNVKEFLGIRSPSRLFMGIGLNVAEGLAIGIESGTELVGDAMQDLAQATEDSTGAITDNFEGMARDITDSLSGLVGNIRNGGFFDILGGLLGVGSSFGKLGLFGQDVQQALSSGGQIFGGFRAEGGPVMSGKSYIVGERGPELFTPNNSGSITPNHALGGGANITVTPSPYFDVAVDERISNAAPSIAAAGGASAISRIQKLQNRRYG